MKNTLTPLCLGRDGVFIFLKGRLVYLAVDGFEVKFAEFLEDQKKGADARRLEMLEKDLTGTKKMFRELLLPVFGSFDGFRLEFRIVGTNGISIYVDALYEPLGLSFECEGFTYHAETITRERFSFERARIRTLLRYGYLYVPFSMDELEKRPEACRSSLRDVLQYWEQRQAEGISLHERELLRYVARLSRPFKLSDVSTCLQMKRTYCLQVIKQLVSKKLIQPLRPSRQRNHHYVLVDRTNRFM